MMAGPRPCRSLAPTAPHLRALAGKSKALVVVEEATEAVAVEAVEVEDTAVVAVVVHTEVEEDSTVVVEDNNTVVEDTNREVDTAAVVVDTSREVVEATSRVATAVVADTRWILLFDACFPVCFEIKDQHALCEV